LSTVSPRSHRKSKGRYSRRQQTRHKTEDDITNTTRPENPHCPWKCELTNEAGYVVYSALGSFYIPMFVMLFFYWRIYRAAIRTTRAINQGFRTTKGSRGFGNRFDEQRLTLRIHRGRGSSGKRHHGSPHSNGSNSTTTTTGSVSPSPSTRGRHERVKISVSYPSNDNLSPPPNPHLLAVAPSSPTTQASYAVHYSVNGKDATSTSLYRRENQLRVQRLNSRRRASSRRSSSCDSVERAPSPSPSSCDDGHKPKVMSRRMGKRNIKAQVKRFRMETKAAKTLAIIVGGFIFCWLPFFTMYVVRAFCPDCIHPLVFSILFWLGYCNSAINPLIYALFSKDFRLYMVLIGIVVLLSSCRERISKRRGG
jgi:octopamine receptor